MAGLAPPRPLSPEDDRSGFDCGRESMNAWFRRHALRNHEDNVSRITVICDPQTGAVAGYVALSAAQIERQFLPKAQQRNRPDPVPAVLLGQLAVDVRFQGRGYARSLVAYALRTSVRLSDDLGCFAVMTHPLDDAMRAFYAKFGFEDLPLDARGSMAVRLIDLRRAGF